MNINTTDITFTTYFKELLLHFYEDESIVKKLGLGFGFDIDKDYFLAISLQYPSLSISTFDEKEALRNALEKFELPTEINKTIAGNQFMYDDNGVSVFLISHNKSELLESINTFKKEIIDFLDAFPHEKKIRVGIGTIESSIDGIMNSYDNATAAIKAGELFKKDRTILDYISMEIYSSINAMVVNYGKPLTTIVLKQLTPDEIHILSKYYKCKELVSETAKSLSLDEETVKTALQQVKAKTGLDVEDTEDNFKLHLVMIARTIFNNQEKLKNIK